MPWPRLAGARGGGNIEIIVFILRQALGIFAIKWYHIQRSDVANRFDQQSFVFSEPKREQHHEKPLQWGGFSYGPCFSDCNLRPNVDGESLWFRNVFAQIDHILQLYAFFKYGMIVMIQKEIFDPMAFAEAATTIEGQRCGKFPGAQQ